VAIEVAAAAVEAVTGVVEVVEVVGASSIAGAAAAMDGADAAEAATTGADVAAGVMHGADAVAEDIGPVATATRGMDTLNRTIETDIHVMDIHRSVLLALAETVMAEIATATKLAKNRATDRRMRKAAMTLQPRSS
jgi:hypothetical protein